MRIFPFLLAVGLLAACHRPDEPAPPGQPPLSETRRTDSSFYAGGLYVFLRTGAPSGYAETNSPVLPANVREKGFCLATSPSELSILNAAAQRIPATDDVRSKGSFRAELTGLRAGQTYYLDTYLVLTDGRVLYGRYNGDRRFTDPPAVSFRVPDAPAPGELQPLRVQPRAALPVDDHFFNTYFSVDNTLYLLTQDGRLFAYDATGDRWARKRDYTWRVGSVEIAGQFHGSRPTVFALGGKAYVYHQILDSNNSTYLGEYDPATDTWTLLGENFKTSLVGYQLAYTQGDRAYFYWRGQPDLRVFDRATRTIQPATTTLAPGAWVTFLPVRGEPFAYFADGTGVFLSRLETTTGRLVNPTLLLPGRVSPSYALATALGDDVLFGSGSTTQRASVLVPESPTPYPFGVDVLNDVLLRYSTRANRVTARYALTELQTAAWNQQAKDGNRDRALAVRTFALNGRVFVVNPGLKSLTELEF